MHQAAPNAICGLAKLLSEVLVFLLLNKQFLVCAPYCCCCRNWVSGTPVRSQCLRPATRAAKRKIAPYTSIERCWLAPCRLACPFGYRIHVPGACVLSLHEAHHVCTNNRISEVSWIGCITPTA
jgi:hypothetical protein